MERSGGRVALGWAALCLAAALAVSAVLTVLLFGGSFWNQALWTAGFVAVVVTGLLIPTISLTVIIAGGWPSRIIGAAGLLWTVSSLVLVFGSGFLQRPTAQALGLTGWGDIAATWLLMPLLAVLVAPVLVVDASVIGLRETRSRG